MHRLNRSVKQELNNIPVKTKYKLTKKYNKYI